VKQTLPPDFAVDPASLAYIGQDLARPECILAHRNGSIWAADSRGGVTHIAPGGAQRFIGLRYDDDRSGAFEGLLNGTLPNGLALASDGRFVIANFGTEALEAMDEDGATTTLFDQIDGRPVGKVNFVLRDSRDRYWVTISTQVADWTTAVRPDLADGYIVLWELGRPPRIVADGFHFTNEIRFDADERYLYVVETTAQRIVRMQVDANGELGPREVFGPSRLGAGGFPDGVTFDAAGNLWGTLVMSDVLFVITPDGEYREILADVEPARVTALQTAFEAGTLTQAQMLATAGTIAPWFSSLTFGGPDLRTVFIGSLRGDRIPCFRSPVPGLAPAHWNDGWRHPYFPKEPR